MSTTCHIHVTICLLNVCFSYYLCITNKDILKIKNKKKCTFKNHLSKKNREEREGMKRMNKNYKNPCRNVEIHKNCVLCQFYFNEIFDTNIKDEIQKRLNIIQNFNSEL